MACINRNTSEFQALKQEFKTDLKTENVINTWQKLNRSEELPTLQQAMQLKKDQQALFSLKRNKLPSLFLLSIKNACKSIKTNKN